MCVRVRVTPKPQPSSAAHAPVVNSSQLTQHSRVVRHEAGQHFQPANRPRRVATHVGGERQAMHNL